MPDPRFMMTCSIPPNELNNILSENNKNNVDTIHLYIDIKNALTALFIPEIVQEIVENTNSMDTGSDSSIFQSVLFSISAWKKWCFDRKLKLKIFFCSDRGRSNYHKEIIKEYKSNRKITNLLLAKYDEAFQVIKEKNFELSENICNKIKDTYFISLDFIEGDFIPYYLITRYFKEEKNILHILASNDKDHHQTLCLPNTVMFTKRTKEIKFWDRTNILTYFTDINKETDINKQVEIINKISKIDPEYSSIMLSFCGDSCDNIPGVSGIGPKRTLDMFSDKTFVENYIGDLNEAIERVHSGGLLLKEITQSNDTEENKITELSNDTNITPPIKKVKKPKVIKNTVQELWKKSLQENEIVTNAFKVISYELLSKWLEKEDNTSKIKNINYIKDTINKSNIKPIESEEEITNFVNMTKKIKDMKLSENTIKNLFI